jgi:hypothetical protein
MKKKISNIPNIRLHLTNINGVGAGASQLLQSLLPAFEQSARCVISKLYLPDQGVLTSYQPSSRLTKASIYKRSLPNALSRFLECTFLSKHFDDEDPLLVFGDLPLRCNTPQTVFVQTAHLLPTPLAQLRFASLKYVFLRLVFRINSGYPRAFIVQTKIMKDALVKAYPKVMGKVRVVAQPVPSWLLDQRSVRTKRMVKLGESLNLIYPAASYLHKNHRVLSKLKTKDSSEWPINRLTLTIDQKSNPAPAVPWIECVGFLMPEQMIEFYGHIDALLFLSKDESYGFPLVEAMFVGVPIICPDLPYARSLCQSEAIYFNPDSITSLKSAINTLKLRLATGWWPNWEDQLSSIPKSWDEVADQMASVALATIDDHK